MNEPLAPSTSSGQDIAPADIPVTHRWPAWLTCVLIAGVATIISALFLRGGAIDQHMALALGGTDPTVAIGFHPGETTPDGRGFRWTDGDSLFRLPAQAPGAHMLDLTLSAPRPDGAPVPFSITINDSAPISLVAQGERHYRFL